MNKKLLTLLCVLALLVTVFGVTAAAAESNVVAKINEESYTSLADAIADVRTDDPVSTVITLQKSVQQAVTFDTTAYLDLNGQNIGPVTVTEGCTLYCFDFATDDYQIEGDEETGYYGFGRLTVADDSKGEIKGVAAGDGFNDSYLKVTDDAGISFHRVTLQITDMTLRTKNDDEEAYNPGLYYKSTFAGDELVAQNVASFGIALSVTEEPNAENFGINNKCSAFTNFVAGETGNEGITSTILKSILKESNGRLTNSSHAQMPIYGRAYILTDQDDYVFGIGVSRSFQEQIQELSGTNDPEKLAEAVPLYRTYGRIMREWDVVNLESAVISDKTDPVISGDKDQPLRILAITSSFGKNTTELLYDVLTAEGYTDVTVARLYSSGGTLKEHAENAENDNGFYQYTKLNKTISEETGGKWLKLAEDYKVTGEPGYKISTALQEEDWDVIFIQQSAAHSPQLNTYSNYIDRLMAVLETDNPNHANTKYIWNMTWAYATSYSDDVFSRYDCDQMTMYNSCVKAVQEKIVPRTDFDAIVPSGTAIQNARVRELDVENDLTSDGRHANALGRTVAAYTVYAAITGQTIEQIALDTIKDTDTTYEIDELTLTESQKAIILESVNAAIANPFHVTES